MLLHYVYNFLFKHFNTGEYRIETIYTDTDSIIFKVYGIADPETFKRLVREKLETIDWINPRDTDARTRSRAVRVVMREAVQPELWRKAYMSAMASACAPLAVVYEPAGVFVKSDGKDVFLPNTSTVAPPNTTLWIAETPIGSKPGMMIKLGTVKQGGLVEFDSASSTVTPGSMVFTIKRGGKP